MILILEQEVDELTTDLDLSHKSLEKIPQEVFLLKNLRRLNISRNIIKEISSDISSLIQLRRLDFHHNQVKTIPKEVFELRYLRVLNMHYNKITHLPPELCHLTHLFILTTRGNCLPYQQMEAMNDVRTRLRLINPHLKKIAEIKIYYWFKEYVIPKHFEIKNDLFVEI